MTDPVPNLLRRVASEIRLAKASDLDAILAIVGETVVQMQQEGSDQWDAAYPDRDRFQQDLQQGTLYVAEREGCVAGFVVADQDEPEEYGPLSWSGGVVGKGEEEGECLVLHRMAIALSSRRQGLASKLEAFVCELAQARGIEWIKTDTYSANTRMLAFFEKRGYRKVGEMRFQGKARPFCCYEKSLVRELPKMKQQSL